MANLQSFLSEAKDVQKPKIYIDENGQYRKYIAIPKKKKSKKKMANMSSSAYASISLLVDFKDK